MSDRLSIFAAAREAPRAVALAADERRFSFADLAALTRQRLRSLPALESGSAHAVIGNNTVDTIVTLYALFERRIPALLLHPRLTDAERREEIAAVARHDLSVARDVAAVLYTSGTTGKPRGAVLTRAALLASAQASAANLGWQDDDCWLLAMPVGRIGGLSIITRCLAARRTVALEPGFDAAALPARLDATRATLLSLVPTALAKLLDEHPQWTPPARLRAILVGGAAAPPPLLQAAHRRGLPIITTYGCTESCSQVVATPYALRYSPSSGAGKPLEGAEIRVVEGRLHVRGPMLMSGYLGEPAQAADAWFDTGDLGHIDAQGFVHVDARRTDLVVTGGENVYPSEVEHALESCPGIAQAAVFGVPDPLWGATIAAALVTTAEPPSDAELLGFLRDRLAPHKRPRHISFVDALPHTAAGKLDRAELPAIARSLRRLA